MEDPIKPTTETDHANLSTEFQKEGDARFPSEKQGREQEPPEETIPRKSSLT